jgi:hypothetical protein
MPVLFGGLGGDLEAFRTQVCTMGQNGSAVQGVSPLSVWGIFNGSGGESPFRLGFWGLILPGARRAEIALLPSKSILFLYIQRVPLRYAGGIPFVQHTTPPGSHFWAIPGGV